MEPSDSYKRAKKYLLTISFLLLFKITSGISIESGSSSLFGLAIEIDNANIIDWILAGSLIYLLYQLTIFWGVQQANIRDSRYLRVDHYFSIAFPIGILGFSFIISILRGKIGLSDIFNNDVGIIVNLVTSAVTGISMIGVLYGSIVLSREIAKKKDKEAAISVALSQNEWELVFDSHSNPPRSKIMRFSTDGGILEGANMNESRWRVENGKLEFLNSNSIVFSRFSYDEKNQVFQNTNEEELLSLRDQYMKLRGNEGFGKVDGRPVLA